MCIKLKVNKYLFALVWIYTYENWSSDTARIYSQKIHIIIGVERRKTFCICRLEMSIGSMFSNFRNPFDFSWSGIFRNNLRQSRINHWNSHKSRVTAGYASCLCNSIGRTLQHTFVKLTKSWTDGDNVSSQWKFLLGK